MQFCIEEAVFERLQYTDRPGPSTVTTTEYQADDEHGPPTDPMLDRALEQARAWHERSG